MKLNNKIRGLSVILIIAIVLVLLAGAFVAYRHISNPVQTTSVSASGQTLYSCPMHPEVVSDKPGKCPKCGMNLEPKKS